GTDHRNPPPTIVEKSNIGTKIASITSKKEKFTIDFKIDSLHLRILPFIQVWLRNRYLFMLKLLLASLMETEIRLI
ncbi:hypothetical protein L0128_01650, partial [candidate division KSB1 bacterium]|nr:hypothetical protein [candidate division KSB1 bacterium]